MANKDLPASISVTAISNRRLGRSVKVISHPGVRFSRTRHIEFMVMFWKLGHVR